MAYLAFDYLTTKLQEKEADYPYKAVDGKCQQREQLGVAHVQVRNLVKNNSLEQLMAAITLGPTGVSVEADKPAFRGYNGGVLNDTACGTATNHAITAVGYGSEDGQAYYIVRNSWGADWGEEGYVRIAAVEGVGICAIQAHPTYPTV